jgi:hypothetical protein
MAASPYWPAEVALAGLAMDRDNNETESNAEQFL